jgi:hypothetical protein
VIAAQIVKRLLEDGEDPKDFLHQHQDLRLSGLDNAFVQNGWAVRGPGEYGKVNSRGDVRWIVSIDERSNRLAATFSGEKRFEGEDRFGRPWRTWQEFDIPDYFVLPQNEGLAEFVSQIEDYVSDFTGPDERDADEPDYDVND